MKVLQFSGGLDSLACLELLKDTPGLAVLTASTDGTYPEREEYLSKVEKAHPHLKFFQVKTNRKLERFGHPVDVLPTKYSLAGRLTQGSPLRYQTHIECCGRALWLPLQDAVKGLGATDVYRGQRLLDEHKAPIRDGHQEGGITYHFPIEMWTREQVREFVEAKCPDLVPNYYDQEGSSRDCWDCTAYLKDNVIRIRNLSPERFKTVSAVLNQWREDVIEETRWQ